VANGSTHTLGALKVIEANADTLGSTEIVTGDVPGRPSTSRTIMLSSLQRLLAELPADASPVAYRTAVIITVTFREMRSWHYLP